MKSVSPSAIEKMERLLATASDKTRIKIMLALLDDTSCCCKSESDQKCESCEMLNCMIEKCVNDIAYEIGASQSLVSHQLKVMKNIQLVGTRKEGRKVYYFLKDKHIRLLLSVAYGHVIEETNNG